MQPAPWARIVQQVGRRQRLFAIPRRDHKGYIAILVGERRAPEAGEQAVEQVLDLRVLYARGIDARHRGQDVLQRALEAEIGLKYLRIVADREHDRALLVGREANGIAGRIALGRKQRRRPQHRKYANRFHTKSWDHVPPPSRTPATGETK
jgi:hypothetical protein